MKKIIMETLVMAALATGQAYAAPISLDNATVTATYQGTAGGMLGLDHGFQLEAGSNTGTVQAPGAGVEFLSADYLFGFDFAADGTLTVYNNMALPERAAGDPGYTFTFDFGSTLAAPIASFTLVDGSMLSGIPGLSVIDGHSIALDLTSLTWNGDFASFTARIGAADVNEVPEPAGLALMMAGVAGLVAASRRTR